jgi:UDP-galactose transporter B1
MFLSVLIAGKSYRPQKYVFVVVIVLGLVLFTCKEKYDRKDGEDPLRGTALIGISLVMDGMMAALQDRMRSVSKPTSLNLMYFLNAWSSLYLAVLLAVMGEGAEFLAFCMRHPPVVFHLGILVSVGSLGQFFISRMISNFGALPLSIVMTVRKFITVFLSVLIYDNELSARKWCAAAIIFLALIFDAVYQLRASPAASSTSTTETHSEQSEENELNNQKNLNLSCVRIDKEFNDTVIGKQVEHESNKCEACEMCSEENR